MLKDLVKNLKGNLKRIILIIIPLIIMIVIFAVSTSLFEQDRKETYQLIKEQKELAVNRLVHAADEAVVFSEVEHLTEEQKFIIQTTVSNLNEQPEVHCYILDNKFNLVSDYNDENMNPEDIQLLYSLSHYNRLEEIINSEDDENFSNNYFNLEANKTNYEFYWRKIPTKNTEFYVLVGISKDKISVNKSVDICKVFIGILNIMLTASLYGNIFVEKLDRKDEK